MGSRKTRRSISIRGDVFARLQQYCTSQGESVSGFVQALVHEKLDEAGAEPARPCAEPRRETYSEQPRDPRSDGPAVSGVNFF